MCNLLIAETDSFWPFRQVQIFVKGAARVSAVKAEASIAGGSGLRCFEMLKIKKKLEASSSQVTERRLRFCLKSEGYQMSAVLKNGQTGADIIACKEDQRIFIEVIGFRSNPPVRSREFYEVFFRAVSRLKSGADVCVIAFPSRFENGLPTRAAHYGEAWKRLGCAFPELQIWLVETKGKPSYRKTAWNDWLVGCFAEDSVPTADPRTGPPVNKLL